MDDEPDVPPHRALSGASVCRYEKMEGANNINQVRGDSFEKKDKSIENSNMIGKTVGLGRDVELV